MLLTISTTHQPATDLGYLLHKHSDRFQSFGLSFGKAHVFYPEANSDRCAASLMLDVDPVGMVRKKGKNNSFLLGHYVNDRPYVASSFMSVAISQVYGTAMGGRCKDRPDLVSKPIPLSASIDVLPVRGGKEFLSEVFEPLGYSIQAKQHPLDSLFPEWGESPYYSVKISGEKTLSELLTHLYVLIPVFDNGKHYYVDDDELEKLLSKGKGWLESHPHRELIARRYLKNRSSLYRQALSRLTNEDVLEEQEEIKRKERLEEALEKPMSLNDQRHGTVLAALRDSGAKSVVDLGCGEGKLLRKLMNDRQFHKILGVDVSIRALEIAAKRLKLERLPERQAERVKIVQGSIMYKDERIEGFDAATVVEVIEHLDPPRLASFERVLFQFAKPKTVVLTTPNSEYNIIWESLPAGEFRHNDHRFEWTREEFQNWANDVCERFQYSVKFIPIGPVDEDVGSPTQMAVFEKA